MNILVCIKQVLESGSGIKLLEGGQGVDEEASERIINPYDEFALEEALKIREQKSEGETAVLSFGPLRVKKALISALAMGIDRAGLVLPYSEEESPAVSPPPKPPFKDPSFVSKVLSFVISKGKFSASSPPAEAKAPGGWDLILLGKEGIDESHLAVGPMLAERLNLAHLGFVTGLKEKEKGQYLVERLKEGGVKEEIKLKLPALVTVEKGLNTPRYPSLPGIMKARKKPLKEILLSSLDLKPDAPPLNFYSFRPPPPPPSVRFIEGAGSDIKAQKVFELLKEKFLN